MLAAVVHVICSLSYGHKRARNKRIGPGGGNLGQVSENNLKKL